MLFLITRARIDLRAKQLTEVLMNELQVSADRSMKGGPRAARRAVTQLVRLGKSALVCCPNTLDLGEKQVISTR